jgi:uncharacterized protein HemX
MGVLTWVLVGIVVLAVIGLGVRTFVFGLQQGVEKIANAPGIRDVVAKTKQLVSDGEDQLKSNIEPQQQQQEGMTDDGNTNSYSNHWERIPT